MTDCKGATLLRLERAPYHVEYAVEDGELKNTGHSELLDARWEETDSFWCSGCDLEIDGEEAARLHALQDEDQPGLMLVLDIEHNTGLTWLDQWGRVNDLHEPVVDEQYAGVTECEQCGNTRACYMLAGTCQSVPVCLQCLEGYDWVVEARKVFG